MKKIIIVDDDLAIRDAVSLVFDPKVYDTQILSNGNTLLQNNFEAPDLFIIDKQLSGADGLEVCRFMKKTNEYSKIPVLIMSANPNIIPLAAAAGADDAIEKPFSIRSLREKVMLLLNRNK